MRHDSQNVIFFKFFNHTHFQNISGFLHLSFGQRQKKLVWATTFDHACTLPTSDINCYL